jgi:hypothetical protein
VLSSERGQKNKGHEELFLVHFSQVSTYTHIADSTLRMQFPKAPRFVAPREYCALPSPLARVIQPSISVISFTAPSEIPGPGAYDPHSPKGHDKKGLLNVVQGERFDSKENNNPSQFPLSRPLWNLVQRSSLSQGCRYIRHVQ